MTVDLGLSRGDVPRAHPATPATETETESNANPDQHGQDQVGAPRRTGAIGNMAEATAAGAAVKEPAREVGGGRQVATVTVPMAMSSGCFRTDDSRPAPGAIRTVSDAWRRGEPRCRAGGHMRWY